MINGVCRALSCRLSLSPGVCRPLSASLSPPGWFLFLGSPGDAVFSSALTNWHGQNESSCVLPAAGLCPGGGLAAPINTRPLGSGCSDCDRPGDPPCSSYIKQSYAGLPTQTGPINGVDGTCQQLPGRYFSTVRLIPAADLPLSNPVPPATQTVQSQLISSRVVAGEQDQTTAEEAI